MGVLCGSVFWLFVKLERLGLEHVQSRFSRCEFGTADELQVWLGFRGGLDAYFSEIASLE